MSFTWFDVERRFIPLIEEGEAAPLPTAADYAEAARLTDRLTAALRARMIPPPEVTRWMDDADLATVGLRRQEGARQ